MIQNDVTSPTSPTSPRARVQGLIEPRPVTPPLLRRGVGWARSGQRSRFESSRRDTTGRGCEGTASDTAKHYLAEARESLKRRPA